VARVAAAGAADRQRFYDGIAGSFDAIMNPYDLRQGLQVVWRTRGVHLFPSVLRWTWPLLRRLDRAGSFLGPVMVNHAVRARKARVCTP
jgi:hypothetical protein